MSDPGHLITAAEAAKRLSVSVRTLERLRATGSGPEFVRIGTRRVGYSRGALDAWTRSRSYPHRAAELATAKA